MGVVTHHREFLAKSREQRSQEKLFEEYYNEFFNLLEQYVDTVVQYGDVPTVHNNILDYLSQLYLEAYVESLLTVLEELEVELSEQELAELKQSVQGNEFYLDHKKRMDKILIAKEEYIHSVVREKGAGKSLEELRLLFLPDLTRLATSEVHMDIEWATQNSVVFLQGVLNVELLKTWNTRGDARVCPICKQLEGLTVPVTESFVQYDSSAVVKDSLDYTGGEITYAHPRCRCYVTYSKA